MSSFEYYNKGVKAIATELSELGYTFIKNEVLARNGGLTREEFFKNNIIDFTMVSEDNINESIDGVRRRTKELGCLSAIPPFETGSFIDDSEHRYIVWKVLDIQDDYYRLSVDFYENAQHINGGAVDSFMYLLCDIGT